MNGNTDDNEGIDINNWYAKIRNAKKEKKWNIRNLTPETQGQDI